MPLLVKVVQRSRVLVLTTQFPALFHFPQIFKYFCLIIKGEPYVQAHNEDSQLKQKLASESNTSSSHVPLQHAPSVTRFSRFHVHRHVSHVKHPELCLSFSLLLQSAAENVQPSFIHAAQALRVCS